MSTNLRRIMCLNIVIGALFRLIVCVCIFCQFAQSSTSSRQQNVVAGSGNSKTKRQDDSNQVEIRYINYTNSDANTKPLLASEPELIEAQETNRSTAVSNLPPNSELIVEPIAPPSLPVYNNHAIKLHQTPVRTRTMFKSVSNNPPKKDIIDGNESSQLMSSFSTAPTQALQRSNKFAPLQLNASNNPLAPDDAAGWAPIVELERSARSNLSQYTYQIRSQQSGDVKFRPERQNLIGLADGHAIGSVSNPIARLSTSNIDNSDPHEGVESSPPFINLSRPQDLLWQQLMLQRQLSSQPYSSLNGYPNVRPNIQHSVHLRPLSGANSAAHTFRLAHPSNIMHSLPAHLRPDQSTDSSPFYSSASLSSLRNNNNAVSTNPTDLLAASLEDSSESNGLDTASKGLAQLMQNTYSSSDPLVNDYLTQTSSVQSLGPPASSASSSNSNEPDPALVALFEHVFKNVLGTNAAANTQAPNLIPSTTSTTTTTTSTTTTTTPAPSEAQPVAQMQSVFAPTTARRNKPTMGNANGGEEPILLTSPFDPNNFNDFKHQIAQKVPSESSAPSAVTKVNWPSQADVMNISLNPIPPNELMMSSPTALLSNRPKRKVANKKRRQESPDVSGGSYPPRRPEVKVRKRPRVSIGNRPYRYEVAPSSQGSKDLQPSETFHKWKYAKYPWLRPDYEDDEEEGETEINLRFFNNFSRAGPFAGVARVAAPTALVASLAFLILSNISLAATIIVHVISTFLRAFGNTNSTSGTSKFYQRRFGHALDLLAPIDNLTKLKANGTVSQTSRSIDTSLEDKIRTFGSKLSR